METSGREGKNSELIMFCLIGVIVEILINGDLAVIHTVGSMHLKFNDQIQ